MLLLLLNTKNTLPAFRAAVYQWHRHNPTTVIYRHHHVFMIFIPSPMPCSEQFSTIVGDDTASFDAHHDASMVFLLLIFSVIQSRASTSVRGRTSSIIMIHRRPDRLFAFSVEIIFIIVVAA
jgi:hypothetical protein